MTEVCTSKSSTVSTGWRDDFPIFNAPTAGNTPLVYLDSGATTQKPRTVIEALNHYYAYDNANVHRGIYALSERATANYEAARRQCQQFIHAPSDKNIVFVRGATEAINLIATSMTRLGHIQAGDEVIVSGMEHHSNIVPWQLLCQYTGAMLKVIPVLDDGTLDLVAYAQLLSRKTKVVAVTHVSNVLGTVNPIKHMTAMAHEYNVPVVVDGAQALAHRPVDVQALDCDFYVASAHKCYGPMGVGFLYAKADWLDRLPPYQGGGSMIRTVSFEQTTFAHSPEKFEAGTPNVAGAVGMATAIRYLNAIGFDQIQAHEQDVLTYALDQLKHIPGLRVLGDAADRIGVVSMTLKQAHPHDIATILDSVGVAIRAGHHCAMPLMTRFGVPATARLSLGVYNTRQDIDQFMRGIEKIQQLFGEAR